MGKFPNFDKIISHFWWEKKIHLPYCNINNINVLQKYKLLNNIFYKIFTTEINFKTKEKAELGDYVIYL